MNNQTIYSIIAILIVVGILYFTWKSKMGKVGKIIITVIVGILVLSGFSLSINNNGAGNIL